MNAQSYIKKVHNYTTLPKFSMSLFPPLRPQERGRSAAKGATKTSSGGTVWSLVNLSSFCSQILMHDKKKKEISLQCKNMLILFTKRRGRSVFLVFQTKHFTSSHFQTLFLYTLSVACLSSLTPFFVPLHGELSIQRRIPKGAAPHFQLLTLGRLSRRNKIVCG